MATGLLLLMAGAAGATQPKCLVVNVGTGQSYGTLQEAVDAVPERSKASLSVKGTCYGDTEIYKSLTLTIAGQGHATLNGGNSQLKPGTVVDVNGAFAEPSVTITGLTITGGYGAGIVNMEEKGTTVNDSVITGNTGFGILNEFGGLTLNNSTVAGNTGTGIWNGGYSHVTLNNSTVTRNTASGCGGGLLTGNSSAMLNDSTITRNTASGNGGGICAEGGEIQFSRIILNGSSLVSRNTASGNGGGIFSETLVTLNDSSSVTQNVASGKGGGIFNARGATLTFGTGWNGTISRNIPDDIFNF